MDTYHVMALGRIRHEELIHEAERHTRFASTGAFERAMLWISEQMIAVGCALRQRYALDLSRAERA